MHVSWWVVLVIVVMSGATIWEGVSSTREARRLRDVLRGGMGGHAETFAKQRRSYQRTLWSGLATGVLFVAFGILSGFSGQWAVAISAAAVGVGGLATAAIAFACRRILGPPRQTTAG
jgi:hypothetical protein